MSILDSTYDSKIQLGFLWDVKVEWYKYGAANVIQKQLQELLNSDVKWIEEVEHSWDHNKLIEALKSMLPPQATALNGLDCRIFVTPNVSFVIILINSTGEILKIKFTKKT